MKAPNLGQQRRMREPDTKPRTLLQLRESLGLGVRDAAKRAGVSPATLSRVERGYDCSVATLIKIARGYGFNAMADNLEWITS